MSRKVWQINILATYTCLVPEEDDVILHALHRLFLKQYRIHIFICTLIYIFVFTYVWKENAVELIQRKGKSLQPLPKSVTRF